MLITLFGLTACELTRNVPKGKYLLRSNTIDVVDNPEIDKYDLGLIIRQQPNQRNFYVNVKLRIYNSIDSSKVAKKREEKYKVFQRKQEKKKAKVERINDKRNAKAYERGDSTFFPKTYREASFSKVLWKEKVKYKFGQKPIVFDTLLYEKSIEQLGFYLRKRGYYYADVHGDIRYNEKKRFVYPTYHIKTGP
ncbi:MAG: POTRA domain-containing protein, partial [Crocinitomicaceae bacterium]